MPVRVAASARAPSPSRPLSHSPAHNSLSPRKPERRASRANTILLTLAAVGLSLTAAAWIAGPDLSALASASPTRDRSSFADRFVPVPKSTTSALLQPLKRLVMAKADFKSDFRPELELSTTPAALASRWPQQDNLRPAIADETAVAPAAVATAPATTATAASIPLPRSRPVAADLPMQTSQVLALASTAPVPATTESLPSHPAERSVLQKFSDMMKARVAVASLGLGRAPDLTTLGYDNETAVYDITAHAVYLPNGTVFEAHSGMGNLRDDPEHVSVPNTGATPPAMYSLKPREAAFHGVAALRMTPAEGSDIGGRSGLLVHSYMLGPNGDSNGCISIRDFDRFRKAYDNGQFSHIAVVPSVKAMILAQQNAD